MGRLWEVRPGRAIAGGLLGTAVLGVTLWHEGHFGVDASRSWELVVAVHVLVGLMFGILYAVAFELLERAGWRLGAALGAAHGLLAHAVLSLTPVLDPLFVLGEPETLGTLMFLGLHIVFGTVVGAVYRGRFAH